jgi:hypothetical protein
MNDHTPEIHIEIPWVNLRPRHIYHHLVGGAITILKNDGVRQWVSDDISSMKWTTKFHGLKPPTSINLGNTSLP